MRFVYIDHKAGDEVVFRCEAASITEADQLYQKALGQNVTKQNHVGCWSPDWPDQELEGYEEEEIGPWGEDGWTWTQMYG